MSSRTNLTALRVISTFLVVLGAAATAAGRTIYVDADASRANNGSSWTDAYRYLQNGLVVAWSGDEIWVAQGTYKPDEDSAHPNGTGSRTATFRLKNGVAVKGGYAGFGEPDPNARDIEVYETVLSGDLYGNDGPDFVNNGENSYQVVAGSGTDETAMLDGFTITGGHANGMLPANLGGGMYNSRSSPTVIHCTFTKNYAEHGGGVHNRESNPILIDCIFQDNYARWDGGGMYNRESSTPTLTNCMFVGNSARVGGGMDNYLRSKPTLTNCTFSGNSATSAGGGIANGWYSRPTFTNCILWDNTATAGPQIYDEETSLTIITYSDVQDGWPGISNINADPLFVDSANGDYHLLPDSPCIDVGDNLAVPPSVLTDLDGKPRIINDTVDMGAYEFHCPSILYVDGDAAGANDGSSWANAYNDLQDALTVAWNGDEIRVAQGIYKPDEDSAHPNGTGSRTATFQLKNGVAIKGGCAGFGEPDPNARDIEAYETILSGDIGIGDSWDNSYHIVTGSGTDANAILDGFTISGGNANSHYGQDRDNGSGMYNVNGNPSVRSCTFSLNAADRCGGGMYNYESNPMLSYCTFSLNAANRFGGGMYNYESNPMLSYCTFRLNYGRVGGGGIYNDYASSPTIVDCTFQENSTHGFGGGIDNVSESSPTLINCMLTGNSSEGYGAGVSMSRSSPTLIGCTLAANSAILGGGGFHCYWSSNLTLINCTLSANSAPYGSAAACRRQDGPSHLQLTNCIIWGDGSEIWNNNDSVITITYTDVQGGWPGEGNIDADPCFADPGYWGHRDDPNIIVEPNDPNALWVYGDYHLLPDSPCIDAGDPNYVAEPNETDLDGKPRIIGGRIDMGAYEYPNTTPVACIVGSNRIVEAQDPWGARVTLDGSCSSDADSAPGTNDDIVSFDWYKVDACDPNFEDFLASGEIIDCNLPLGEHIIVLEVTDKADAFDTNEVTIIVQDTTPPDFTLFVTPTTLWPANHKMVLITPTWTVSDICDDSPVVSLVSITMNEGDEAKGDGHTTLNIQIGDDGSIYLRAERSGTGSGRIYTITYQAVDDSGNAAVARATVTVPHDQR